MTVLRQQHASGAQLGLLGRIIGSTLIAGVIVAGAVFAVSQVESNPSVSASYERAMQARGQAADIYWADQLYLEARGARGEAADVYWSDRLFVEAMEARGRAADLHFGAQATAKVDLSSRIEGFPVTDTPSTSVIEPTGRTFGTIRSE